MGHSDSASTSLAPGFRFHPTDEELVSYYLKRKVCGKPFRFDAISEIDIYKVEPWDLPGLSKLKSRDLEWYFFSGLDRKYGNGSRTNRATCEGYWKTTGKDRPVHHRSRVVGMKKTLVYHHGRAPHGKRTNWVMHEYKLVDEALEKACLFLDGVVLCRIFQKSGTGPKNGEKYGAPFIEEEWEEENVGAVVPSDVSSEAPSVVDDAFIEQNDLDQKIDFQLQGNETLPANHIQEDFNVSIEDFGDIAGNEKSFAGESAQECGLNILDTQKSFDLPVQVGSCAYMVNERMTQPNDVSDEVTGKSLSNETFSDILGYAPLDDELFLDATDFLNPAEENLLDFGLVESFMEDDIDIGQYLSFDSPPGPLGGDVGQQLSSKENLDGATSQLASASQQLAGEGSIAVASSSQQTMDIPESKQSKQDMQYPFLGHASRLLENIHAPPAFASEFPPKDMAARLNALQSSSSFHVTAGMIRLSGMTDQGSRLHWSFDKAGNVNVLLSIDVPQDINEVSVDSLSCVISNKMAAAVSRGWLRFMFLWVMFLAVSIKVGCCIYAK